MENYEAAESYLLKARDIDRVVMGEDHPEYATDLNNIAGLYQMWGHYAKAEPLLQQVLEIRREALGENDLEYAGAMNDLAAVYSAKGDYAEAEPLYERALEIRREILGEEHRDVTDTLINLASLYVAVSREDEAVTLAEQAAAINNRMIGRVFSFGSENQRMAYLRLFWGNVAILFSMILTRLAHSSAAIQVALDQLLRRKGIGAEALSAQRDAVLGGLYPNLEPKVRELVDLRDGIARKTLAGADQEELETHQQLLAQWNTQKEQLEAELARKIPEMNLEQQLRNVDRSAVARSLPKGSALIEFFCFAPFDFKPTSPVRHRQRWQPARYVAFTLLAGESDAVQKVDLGEAEPIDRLIASFRASITGEAERNGDGDGGHNTETEPGELSSVSVRSERLDLREAIIATRHTTVRSVSEVPLDAASLGAELRKKLFDPLLPALDGRSELFVAPDGDLNRLPFEVLPGSRGNRLIDEYRICYVGVGRDLLRFERASTVQPGPPLVAADPDFELRSAGGQHTSSTGGVPFERLQGTRREGEWIGRTLDVAPLVEGEALEKTIKNSRSPRILHLATHGFFLPDALLGSDDAQPDSRTVDGPGSGGLSRLTQAENPLLRSGLALAGANTSLGGEGDLPEEAEDGLLTAEDVTGMDLLATELVILSACETGLGQVHIGEGVYGLRRAFVLAGAKTLVMSLWKVPDQQTQELMEDFYQRLLAGQPRAEALRKAQLAMKDKYPDPLYWGAFVCQGDPGPLSQRDAEG